MHPQADLCNKATAEDTRSKFPAWALEYPREGLHNYVEVIRTDGAREKFALGRRAHMQWLVGFHPHSDEWSCLMLVGSEGEDF